jgi:hypothetical protein
VAFARPGKPPGIVVLRRIGPVPCPASILRICSDLNAF